ncbi:MAG: MerR family transcriptional regulator [Chitinivibrionales bacterium]|nr:MerR family transcriptional regulator [Chitinivibrionales bacterium]
MPRKIDSNKPLFAIGTVAEILNVKPRVLRFYEERGLIHPTRTDGNRRLYSLNDIDVLAYIQYLTTVKRVNISGVIEIQKLLKKLNEEARAQFMEEIEEEINLLPLEKKKAYTGEDESFSEEMFKASVEFDNNSDEAQGPDK